MRINPSKSSSRRLPQVCLVFLIVLTIGAGEAAAQLSSYATSAMDIVGTTGAPGVALGVPDYQFVNDSGLGFGGSSTDVFGVGETVELSFPAALRNHPSQDDLVLYVFVGGLGATDNANVQVEASSDGTNFAIIDTFNTELARSQPWPDIWENDFEAVKHFSIEFGSEDNVTHIRLTNLNGTSEGLRLDAAEGLHPSTNSTHAFEVRIERVRPDDHQRFRVRLKNIGDPSTVPIREWRMDRTNPLGTLQDTHLPLQGVDGEFICVENCIRDNDPTPITFSRHVWSTDGSTEAPLGTGLDPGRQVEIPMGSISFDTDAGPGYLVGFTFTVTFADGFSHTFAYDSDVSREIGSIYQQYLYFTSSPTESWNRPVDYYEFASQGPVPVPSLSPLALLPMMALVLTTGAYLARRQLAVK